MRDSWSTTHTNNYRAKGTNLYGNIINNLEYDAPLEVRYWGHPAELAIIHEVENGSTYTAEVYTDGSKIGDNIGAAVIIFCEWQVGKSTEV